MVCWLRFNKLLWHRGGEVGEGFICSVCRMVQILSPWLISSSLCDIAELGRDVHIWLSSAGNSELQHTTGKQSLDGRVPVRVEEHKLDAEAL